MSKTDGFFVVQWNFEKLNICNQSRKMAILCQYWTKEHFPNPLESTLLCQILVFWVTDFKFWPLAYFLISFGYAKFQKDWTKFYNGPPFDVFCFYNLPTIQRNDHCKMFNVNVDFKKTRNWAKNFQPRWVEFCPCVRPNLTSHSEFKPCKLWNLSIF